MGAAMLNVTLLGGASFSANRFPSSEDFGESSRDAIVDALFHASGPATFESVVRSSGEIPDA